LMIPRMVGYHDARRDGTERKGMSRHFIRFPSKHVVLYVASESTMPGNWFADNHGLFIRRVLEVCHHRIIHSSRPLSEARTSKQSPRKSLEHSDREDGGYTTMQRHFDTSAKVEGHHPPVLLSRTLNLHPLRNYPALHYPQLVS